MTNFVEHTIINGEQRIVFTGDMFFNMYAPKFNYAIDNFGWGKEELLSSALEFGVIKCLDGDKYFYTHKELNDLNQTEVRNQYDR